MDAVDGGTRGFDGSPKSPTPPWVADRALDAAGARAAIRRNFPEVDTSAIEWVGSGWEFDVFRAGEWAFRFPRRQEYAQQFTVEQAVLDLVSQALAPVRSPSVELFGQPGPEFPYAFAGHRFLQGRAADSSDIELDRGFAEELGSALGRLHSVDPAGSTALATDDETLVDWLNETLGDAAEIRGLSKDVDDALAWLEAGPSVPPEYAGPLRVVHNDICPDHLLVDPQTGRLAAIIDWTDACLGDPILDFTVLWAWLGEAFVHDVLEAYDLGIDPGFDARLRFSVRVRTLHWLHSAVQEGGDVAKHLAWVSNAFA